MERGCNGGSFLKTCGVQRVGVGGTQAHIPALRTRRSRAAESEGGTKLPPPPSKQSPGWALRVYKGNLRSPTLVQKSL